ncbi:hypothetical protein [Arthrobacter sp.]|uniref:hypothetical protein n=1 Tax=Arthrobacter sp. TaxID=1667 RepID=UPI002810AAA2|nr:hypothetical protein [Arthrobacter sp.]
MNTRSCLLTVGVSALLATGTVLTAAPASAAPGSAECVAAQAALSTQLGVASVDITLANQLRDAINAFDSIDAQLYPLYAEADLAVADEVAALDDAEFTAFKAAEAAEAAAALLTAAAGAEAKALAELDAAEAAVLAVPAGDTVALAEAEAARDEAQGRYDAAVKVAADAKSASDAAAAEVAAAAEKYEAADQAYLAAAEVAYGTPQILALEAQFEATIESFDDAYIKLGLTEGADPEQLLALADAAVAACSAPVANKPAVTVSAPQQRGLNIQTAAYDAGASDPANLALLAGLAGLGAAAVSGAVVVRRRRNARA